MGEGSDLSVDHARDDHLRPEVGIHQHQAGIAAALHAESAEPADDLDYLHASLAAPHPASLRRARGKHDV